MMRTLHQLADIWGDMMFVWNFLFHQDCVLALLCSGHAIGDKERVTALLVAYVLAGLGADKGNNGTMP